jgi:hypothetical protein
MLISALLTLVAAVSLNPVQPYSPPGIWNTVTSYGMDPDIYTKAGLTPPNIIWTRKRETVHWGLFSPTRKLDDAESVIRILKHTRWPLNEKLGPITSVSESRCAGTAWWIHWTYVLATGNIEVQELFFQHDRWQAMIAYSSPTGKMDKSIPTSMIGYCARFNPQLSSPMRRSPPARHRNNYAHTSGRRYSNGHHQRYQRLAR